MINTATNTRHRMWLEEWLNTLSHVVGIVLSLIGFVFLVHYGAASPKDWALVSAIVFGLSLIAVYISSSLYHAALTDMKLKRTLGIIDHSCIFLLIAGTHTPLLLLSIRGDFGWNFFWLEWGFTFIGILIKIFYKEEFDKYSVWLYLVMASVAGLKSFQLQADMGAAGFSLMLIGASSYIIGLWFFLWDKNTPFAHFFWHLFVLLGSTLHYFAILFFILN